VAVLRGEATEGVQRHSHDRLAVFGIGADHPATYWRGMIRQLIAVGALDVDTAGHGGLLLAPEKARPILRGEVAVMMRQDAPRPVRSRVPPVGAGFAEPTGDTHLLFEALRVWRAGEARRQSVPPYVIFHDSVLREIAASRPASLVALGQIKGVGASKLQRYGLRVLEVTAASAPA
jgi:ATP-dependent DNA helicase RecQ